MKHVPIGFMVLLAGNKMQQYVQEMVAVELKPNGANLPVTNDNRQEYVKLYVHQIVSVLPGKAMGEFISGFKRVMDGQAFQVRGWVESRLSHLLYYLVRCAHYVHG